MAFTVQDDTGTVDGANAYISTAYMVSYFADRNITIANTTDAEIAKNEAAIIRATSYVDQRFCYIGAKLEGYDQTTQWPREQSSFGGVYVGEDLVEGLPREVEQASAEYAYRAWLDADGAVQADPTLDPNIKSERKKLDVLVKDTEYWGAGNSLPVYPTADNILTRSDLTCSGQKTVGRA